jgi:predicted nucleotidyltransferase
MSVAQLIQSDLDWLREVLRANTAVYAAALYGSAARGDLEAHSDIDLILICSRARKISQLMTVRESLSGHFQRLSITVYTERELLFLRSVNSLFVLHLSREAVPLVDHSGFLERLFSEFRPKSSYRDDFAKSLRLLEPLRLSVMGAPNNLHRLSYIYSLFRVFGVYLLAEDGIYEFSKTRMAQNLRLKFPDKIGVVTRLTELRELNSNFFTGGTSQTQVPTASVDEAVAALAAIAGVSFKVQSVSFENAVQHFLNAIGPHERAFDYRLRMWFLILIYDGLNLYFERATGRTLTSLSLPELNGLIDLDTAPSNVTAAIRQTIEYLESYPLKYFLDENCKIKADRARRILLGMCEEIN